jgi:integrase
MEKGKGAILCNRCRKSMTGAVCTCGNLNCYISFYWKGQHYTSRRDSSGEVYDFREAVKVLTKINTVMQDRHRKFDAADWTDAAIKQRRFENLMEDYHAEKEHEMRTGELSPEYFRIIRNYYKNYFKFFDGYDVREIDRETLSEFKRKCLKDLKIKSRKNVRNALHAFFHWLYDNGHILHMPSFPEIKGDDATPRRAIRKEAQEAGLKNIPEQFRDPIEFMMKTGMRPGELCAVLVRSVDMASRTVWVERSLSGSTYRETTKNKSKLPIPLNDKALEIAKRNVRGKFPNDFLFINPVTNDGYRRKYLWGIWDKYSGSGVKLYEATRHSFCTQVVPLTESFDAQRLMRHRDKRSTDNYYHAYTETLLDVLQRMDNVVDLKETKKRKRKGNES